MKIGIIGHNVFALEQVMSFQRIGAEVTLLHEKPLLGDLSSLKELHPHRIVHDFQSSSKENLGEQTYIELWEKYLAPLKNDVESYIKCKNVKVKRVHKRFLAVSEEVANHSRLHDLFRVVYAFDSTGVLKEQLESTPDMFKDMPKEVMESMASESEAYEDFDIIIESQESGYAMGPAGAHAINEQMLAKSEFLLYGMISEFYLNSVEKFKCISLVGTNEMAALNILTLREWLIRPGNQINIVTDEKDPFSGLRSTAIYKELFSFLDEIELLWQKECEVHQHSLHQWRALDPHERVKTPEPVEPVSPIQMYHCYNVTSLDKLIDREGLFLTIEKPTFRDTTLEREVLATIASEAIVVTTPQCFNSLGRGMRINNQQECIQEQEPGFYFLRETADIDAIQKNVLSFFSRKDN